MRIRDIGGRDGKNVTFKTRGRKRHLKALPVHTCPPLREPGRHFVFRPSSLLLRIQMKTVVGGPVGQSISGARWPRERGQDVNNPTTLWRWGTPAGSSPFFLIDRWPLHEMGVISGSPSEEKSFLLTSDPPQLRLLTPLRTPPHPPYLARSPSGAKPLQDRVDLLVLEGKRSASKQADECAVVSPHQEPHAASPSPNPE